MNLCCWRAIRWAAFWRWIWQSARRAGNCRRLPGILTLAAPLFFHKWRPFFMADRRFLLLPILARLHPVLRLPPRDAASRHRRPLAGS